MWTVSINLDSDKEDVGTVSCVWNMGKPDQFAFNRRLRVAVDDGKTLTADGRPLDSDMKLLVADAKKAKDKRDATALKSIELAKLVEGLLNGLN